MNNYYDEYEEEIDLLEIWNNFLKKWKIGVIIVGVCALIGLCGSLLYNKLNYQEPQPVDEKDLTTTTTTTTYNVITTNDIKFNFYSTTYSEDGLTNITANNFVSEYNTASYKNSILKDLDLKDKYSFSIENMEGILSIYQGNGIITVSVQMDRDWYLRKVNKNDLTNQEAIDEITNVENEIINKVVSDISNDLNGLATYEVLNTPVTRVTTATVENPTDTTTTQEVVVEDKTVSVSKYTLIAIVLGVVGYCAYVFVLTLLDKTLKSPEDIKRFIDYPVLGYIKNDESYKSLAITLTNITNAKTFNIVAPTSDSDELVNKLNDALNELGYKSVIKDTIKKSSKGVSSYTLINSKAINDNSLAITSSNEADETIIYTPTRVFTRQDLDVTKEIIKNNNIKVTGVVIK